MADRPLSLSGGRIVGPDGLPPGAKKQASLIAAEALELLARELDEAGQPYGARQVRDMAVSAKQWGASPGTEVRHV
jgi:hypothetical protein